MAPEVLSIKKNEFYDEKADIWSVGVIFYELIYGRLFITIYD
jgi:serine/threonine protein kinase